MSGGLDVSNEEEPAFTKEDLDYFRDGFRA